MLSASIVPFFEPVLLSNPVLLSYPGGVHRLTGTSTRLRRKLKLVRTVTKQLSAEELSVIAWI